MEITNKKTKVRNSDVNCKMYKLWWWGKHLTLTPMHIQKEMHCGRDGEKIYKID